MSNLPGKSIAIPSVAFLDRTNRVVKAFEGTPQFTAGSFMPNRSAISPFVGNVTTSIKYGLDPENAAHGGKIRLTGETDTVRAFAGMLESGDTISTGLRVEGLCINGIYRIFNAECEEAE